MRPTHTPENSRCLQRRKICRTRRANGRAIGPRLAQTLAVELDHVEGAERRGLVVARDPTSIAEVATKRVDREVSGSS